MVAPDININLGITHLRGDVLISFSSVLDLYPKFVGEYFGDKLGNYAWKPIIVDEIMDQNKSKVVWLDAGNLITKKIIFLKISLTALGIVVPTSSNSIKDWTHPKTIDYIGIHNKYLNSNNYASGLIGFDYNYDKAKNISQLWSKFSQIQECISPTDSSRENHRQDPAVLTLLLYKYFFTNNFTIKCICISSCYVSPFIFIFFIF